MNRTDTRPAPPRTAPPRTTPPRTTSTRRPPAPIRLVAAATLVGMLAGLPTALVTLVGRPRWSAISTAFDTGRIDDTAIVHIGTVLFLGLWVWFAFTAVAEAGRVVAWKSGGSRRNLAPTASSPTGVVRRLVRAAMISTTVTVTAMAPLSPLLRATPAVLAGTDVVHPDGATRGVLSSGRDTPYSIAVRLGDPDLRNQIIELNQGRIAPGGGTWAGGVFPAGLTVLVPAGVSLPRVTAWEQYTVVNGDSVYQIATHIARRLPDSDGHGARVRDLADQILDRNLGRQMNDGAVFDDASLIRPGWLLDVPGTDVPGTDAPVSDVPVSDVRPGVAPMLHVVRSGDSYWSIAEAHLRRLGSATAHDIAVFSDALVETNAAVLGHGVDTLLIAGDAVRWGTSAAIEGAHDSAVPTADEPPAAAPPATTPPATTPAATIADDGIVHEAAPHPTVLPTVTPPVPPAAVGADTTAAPAGTGPVALPDVDRVDGAPAATRAAAPIRRDLAGVVLLCAGAIGVIESRRRRMLRATSTRSQLAEPSSTIVATERVLRSLDAVQRAVRLDLALRSAGHRLGRSGGHVLGAVTSHDGEITLMLDRPGQIPRDPWSVAGSGTDHEHDAAVWRLDAGIADDLLVDDARLAGQPCPTLVQLGTIMSTTMIPGVVGGELFIDLEAFGMVCIDGPADATDDIIRGIVASLQLSPVGQLVNIVGHALPTDSGTGAPVGVTPIDHADTLDDALDRAAVMLGSTPTAIGGRRTFELRARGTGGETWEPAVLVSTQPHQHPGVLGELISATRGGGRGLAAVVAGRVEGAGLTLAGNADGWGIERLGLAVVPVGLTATDRCALVETIARVAEVISIAPSTAQPVTAPEIVDSPWQLLVHVLGTVAVTTRDGSTVTFERGKSLELVTWLSQHRERPTRSAARTALWELAVRDATFANVVSDARRTMARASNPPAGVEWIERTLTEALPLHELVTSDAELLRRSLLASAGLDADQRVRAIRPALELVTGMPFGSTGYLWPDAEGISTALTMLVTSAAAECARNALELDDIDTVFWATGQGLKVLAGHEELIGLRMRAHAQRGDRAGVRTEFEAYERALHADQWSDEEPSPKLVELRYQLLDPRARTIA